MQTDTYTQQEQQIMYRTPSEQEMGSLYWGAIMIDGGLQWHLIQRSISGDRHFHTGEYIDTNLIRSTVPFLKTPRGWK